MRYLRKQNIFTCCVVGICSVLKFRRCKSIFPFWSPFSFLPSFDSFAQIHSHAPVQRFLYLCEIHEIRHRRHSSNAKGCSSPFSLVSRLCIRRSMGILFTSFYRSSLVFPFMPFLLYSHSYLLSAWNG